MNLIQAFNSKCTFRRTDLLRLCTVGPNNVPRTYGNTSTYEVDKNGFLRSSSGELVYVSDRSINGQYEFLNKSKFYFIKTLWKNLFKKLF